MSRGALIIGEVEREPARPLARRRRRRPWRSRLVLLAVIAVVLGAGLPLGWRWLCRSPRFEITRVETSPYRFTDRVELEATIGVALERNLWSLDTEGLTARIEALPWVRRARLVRRLPGTLQVHFDEWRPVAVMAGEEGIRGLLLENGDVARVTEALTLPALPYAVDFDLEPGPSGEPRRVAGDCGPLLLELLAAVNETGLEQACPVDFVLQDERGFSLVLREDRSRLVVGDEEFRERLRKYLAIRGELEPGGEVDLRFRSRIAVG